MPVKIINEKPIIFSDEEEAHLKRTVSTIKNSWRKVFYSSPVSVHCLTDREHSREMIEAHKESRGPSPIFLIVMMDIYLCGSRQISVKAFYYQDPESDEGEPVASVEIKRIPPKVNENGEKFFLLRKMDVKSEYNLIECSLQKHLIKLEDKTLLPQDLDISLEEKQITICGEWDEITVFLCWLLEEIQKKARLVTPIKSQIN